MFLSKFVAARWCLLALSLVLWGGDAALTRRQYGSSSSSSPTNLSLNTVSASTVSTIHNTLSTSTALSSPTSSSAVITSATSPVFSKTQSTSSLSSPSTTSSTSNTSPLTSSLSSSSTSSVANIDSDNTKPSANTSEPFGTEPSPADHDASSSQTPAAGLTGTSTDNPLITSAPATSSFQPHNSSFPITSGPTLSGNASVGVPHIYFGCTPDPVDPWHDARSCSCESRLWTYYATQSTGDSTFTVCHTKGEESYGLQYSAGCSLTTTPLLKTPWVAPDNCCGYCKIEVPTVRIVYWAPQTAAPNVSYATGNFSATRIQRGPVTAVEDGYTFTSPSVYIVYSSIHASASCVAFSQTYHTVGGTHVVTRAYPPDHLSSVKCVNSIGVGQGHLSLDWEPINYNDLYYPIPQTESLSRIDRCFANRQDNNVWGDWMRKPFISLPKDVSELDPTWTTCSGVAIGAMDPPRALVPAAGWEDEPPPTKPADPATPGPITQTPPSLPKATPGRTVPDPGPSPTLELSPMAVPKPDLTSGQKGELPEKPHDRPPDPRPDLPKPSQVDKRPDRSPEVAAPQPQPPSTDIPAGDRPSDNKEKPDSGMDLTPPTKDNKPAAKQPSGDTGKQQPAEADPLKSVSAILFPNPSPDPKPGKQAAGSGSGEQTTGNRQHPSPNNPDVKDDPASGGTRPDTQNSGTPDSNPAAAATPNDQSPDRKQKSDSKGDSSSKNGGHAVPSDPKQPQTVTPASKDESTDGPAADKGGSRGSKTNVGDPNGAPFSPGKSGTKPVNEPSDFTFASDAPPPVAGSHTIARAPGGAAVVGTATIHPGEAQTVQGTPVSVAPNAIIVGSSTFAVIPPQQAQTPPAAPAISQVPGGGLVVGSNTIMPGQKDSINGHDVSVGSSNVIVDGKVFAVPAVTPAPSIQPVNVGGVQVARGPGNAVVVGGSTYKPGAQITVSGHAVSVGSGEVVVDGKTHSLPSPPGRSPLLIDGQDIRKASDGNIIVGTATLSPGSRTTLSGHDISVGNDNKLVVDQSTYAVPMMPGAVQVTGLPTPPSVAPLVIDGQAVSKDANGDLVIGTSTIHPASQVTMAGHFISAASGKVIVDGRTYDLPTTAGAVEIPAETPFTLSNGVVLTPGATAVTVSGEVISVFSNNKGFVIDGSTFTIPTSTIPLQSVFTVAGQIFTAAPSSFAIGDTTVSIGGPAATIAGTVVSLGTAGLQIGSKTFALPTPTPVTTPELGDFVMSAFDKGAGAGTTTAGGAGGSELPSSASGSTGAAEGFQSGAERNKGDFMGTVLLIMAVNTVLGVFFG